MPRVSQSRLAESRDHAISRVSRKGVRAELGWVTCCVAACCMLCKLKKLKTTSARRSAQRRQEVQDPSQTHFSASLARSEAGWKMPSNQAVPCLPKERTNISRKACGAFAPLAGLVDERLPVLIPESTSGHRIEGGASRLVAGARFLGAGNRLGAHSAGM